MSGGSVEQGVCYFSGVFRTFSRKRLRGWVLVGLNAVYEVP